jgi:hypothetical protein
VPDYHSVGNLKQALAKVGRQSNHTIKAAASSSSSLGKSGSETDLAALSTGSSERRPPSHQNSLSDEMDPPMQSSAINAPIKTGFTIQTRWFGRNCNRYLVLRQMCLEIYESIESFEHGFPCSSILLIGAKLGIVGRRDRSIRIRYSGKFRTFRMADASEASSWCTTLAKIVTEVTPAEHDMFRV